MKNTFAKKIEKNNKKIVKNVSKTMKKNPNATVAIAATAGTGFIGLGVLNIVQHMRNRKALKKAKAMDEARASSTNANQAPEQEPQEEPTTTSTTAADTLATAEPSSPVSNINPEILQAAFNEFNYVRNDPRSQGWTDEQIATTVAQRFASEPNHIVYIIRYILNLVAEIKMQNLQATVMRTNNATQPHEPNTSKAFDEPEETTNDETDGTNPDEGKYPASSKKQQKNGNKGNNKK